MRDEVRLIRSYKADGASVVAGDLICELETENATVDLSAPHAGSLRQLKHEGETIERGEEVAKIE